MPELRLVPVSGPPIDVVKDPTMVGRDPSCDIVVTDGSVSRRHARLERRAGEWWVVDQGSANGTYLNSLRIAEQALQTGQELRFGALAYRVETGADPEATVATPVLDGRLRHAAGAVQAPAAAAAARPRRRCRRRPERPAAVPPPPPLPHAAATPPPPAERRRARGSAPARRPARRSRRCRPAPRPAKKGTLAPVLGRHRLLRLPAAGRCSWSASSAAASTWRPRRGRPRPRRGSARCGEPDRRGRRRPQPRLPRPADPGGDAGARHARSRRSTDATFLSRSVENDRAVLKGVLTGGPRRSRS